jgi:hypothetical protein
MRSVVFVVFAAIHQAHQASIMERDTTSPEGEGHQGIEAETQARTVREHGVGAKGARAALAQFFDAQPLGGAVEQVENFMGVDEGVIGHGDLR